METLVTGCQPALAGVPAGFKAQKIASSTGTANNPAPGAEMNAFMASITGQPTAKLLNSATRPRWEEVFQTVSCNTKE